MSYQNNDYSSFCYLFNNGISTVKVILETYIVREKFTELKWCLQGLRKRWLPYIEDYCIMLEDSVSEQFRVSVFRVKDEGSSSLISFADYHITWCRIQRR
jgi:hypothetical protein